MKEHDSRSDDLISLAMRYGQFGIDCAMSNQDERQFDCHIEPDRHLLDGIIVSITNGGNKWTSIRLTKDEARILVGKINDYILEEQRR